MRFSLIPTLICLQLACPGTLRADRRYWGTLPGTPGQKRLSLTWDGSKGLVLATTPANELISLHPVLDQPTVLAQGPWPLGVNSHLVGLGHDGILFIGPEEEEAGAEAAPSAAKRLRLNPE